MESNLLSIVVPAFNEQEVLPRFHERINEVLSKIDIETEIQYVNDGSTDDTLSVMMELRDRDSRVAVLDLSRNFGKEIALTAGLERAEGDIVVVIDADLQDPPELIPVLVERWKEGFDVVYAQRKQRLGESRFKRLTAHGFYRLMQGIGRVKIPEDTGDFRLLSRRAVNALLQIKEHHRFMKGLFSWIGFRQTAVPFSRDPRYAGETKWNYMQLWNLAIEGITSFTIVPLKISTYVGVVTAFGAFFYGLFMMFETLMYGNPVAGYPSLIVIILFLGGVQLVSIGVLGEYIGRIFNETKRRPLYFVNSFLPRNNLQTLEERSCDTRPKSSYHMQESGYEEISKYGA